MNKIKTYFFMAIAGILATACSQDEELTKVNNSNEVTINPGVQATVVTRADDSQLLATINPGASLVLGYDSDKTTFVYNPTDSKWVVKSGATPLYWDDLAPNSGSAYAFTAMAPADYSAGGSVANQSNKAKYLAADLLGATCTTETRKQALDILLTHRMAQIVVTLSSSDIDLSDATLTVKGAKPTYTGAAAATGNAGDITPLKTATGNYLFVLPAQSLAAETLALEFAITVEGVENSYLWKNSDLLNVAAGESTAINLTLQKSGVVVGAVKVSDWVSAGDAINETVQMVISGTPGTVTGDAPTFTTFELWMNTDEANAITYNLIDDAWTLDDNDTPFYVDEVDADDRFYARHTPADADADAITGVKDILETGAVEMKAGQLALLFKHVNAKLTVQLVAGDDFPESIDPDEAEVTLLNYSTAAEGAETHFILAKETEIEAGEQIASISLNGKTYNAILTDDLVFDSGEHTTLTVTLNPTGITMAVAVKAWEEAEASATGAVTLSANSFDDMPEVEGTLTLKYGDLTGSYTWNGTAITNSTHLYWENISEADSYSFTLTFTPTAAHAVTDVKDILEGTTTVMTHGAQPSFTGNSSLKHTKARLGITLAKGTGFPTDVSLNNATIVYLPDATTPYTGNDLILESGTIAKDTKIVKVTTSQGLVYNAFLSADLTLTGGEHTLLTVTLNPTATTMSVSVVDWGTPVEKEATAAVTIAPNSLSALPGDGTLALVYGNNTYTANYSYTKSSGALTLTSGSTHIYWENIPTTSMGSFTLTYTPSASGTPEKDILKGTATSPTHGAQLTVDLAHTNSRINIILAKGGSYSGSEWTAITGSESKTTVTIAGLTTDAYAANYNYTVDAGVAGAWGIFKPKTAEEFAAITSPEPTITVEIPAVGAMAANSVTINLKNYTESLVAGKKYDITITVDKNRVGAGNLNVTDWTTVTGSGTIEY